MEGAMSELRFQEFFLLEGTLPGRVAFTIADNPDQAEATTLVTVRSTTVAKGSQSYDLAQITVLRELNELVNAEIARLEDLYVVNHR
jgi:hypothetical protein